MMKRFIAIFMAVATALPLVNVPLTRAATVTGPWTWTDLSAQLTERNNRPIWAMANANGSWFYTDGQDLWNGGQVYRYDGSTQVNITSDVRNAGVSRVDDVVSDGQTVLFLQNIVRMDNQLTVVGYQNGQYLNVTSNVRNALMSDEGVSSISGRNGTWYIVTTKNRLFRWSGNATTPTHIALPDAIVNQLENSPSALIYNVNHGSAATGRVTLAMLPISNGHWLLIADPTNGSVRFYRYDGSTFSDISGTSALSNVETVSKSVSNGSQAFLSTYGFNRNPQTGVTVTDGASSVHVSSPGVLNNALIAWNGTSWIVLSDKNLYRFVGSFANNSGFASLGTITDYFDTIASDANGRFLLGGAVSVIGTNAPTNPLTAKLVMVTEGVASPIVNDNTNGGTSTDNTVTVGGTFGGDRVYTSPSGPQVRIQGNPSGFRVGNGKEFAYRVTASDANGVDRTDVYVNDARIKACYADVCEFRTTYWVNGQTTRTIKFWTRSTDKAGYSTDTSGSPDFLTVDINSSLTADGTVTNSTNNTNSTGATTDGNGSSWTWLDPNTTTLNKDQSVTFNVGAQDADGLNQIDVYANGSVIRTCTFGNSTANQTCSVVVYANTYTQGTSVFVNAKMTDGKGNVFWSASTTLARSTDTGTGTGTTTDTTGSNWTWIDPNLTTLNKDQSVIFYVGAQDNDGLQQADIYANGSVIRTCSFGGATSNQTCSATISANSYAQGTSVFVNAKLTDATGTVTWTNSTTLTRATDGASNNTGTQAAGKVSAWSWFEPSGDLARDNTTQFRSGAWAEKGLSSVELWVNGSVKRTCSFSAATGNQSCDLSLNGADYTVGTSIAANAKATDVNGVVSWSDIRTINVVGSATDGTGGGSGNTAGSVTVSSDKTGTYRANDLITITSNGTDADRIGRSELWVNARLAKVCLNSGSCSVTVGPFPNNLVVTYGASLFDVNGNVSTSGYKQLFLTQ